MKNIEYSRSGVYNGGLGAGGFDVMPDGSFKKCQVYNDWKSQEEFKAYFFYSRKPGEICALRKGELIFGQRVIPGVKEIEYDGSFPVTTLYYPELELTLQFISFFIPGDIKNSSLPAVAVRVKGKGRLLYLQEAPGKPEGDKTLIGSGYNSLNKNTPSRLKARSTPFLRKGELGDSGIWAGKGKTFCTPHNAFTMEIFQKNDKYPPQASRWYWNEKKWLLASIWEGKFDDWLVIGWNYPDMEDLTGKKIGHYYSNYFNSAESVLKYVSRNFSALLSKTMKFHEKIKKGNKPEFLESSYRAQLSTFVRASWLTKDGSFGVWEGSPCCCGLQTTDVAYYGSWLYLNLFPELERKGIELTAKFQRKDGWIAHFFPGTFDRIDEYRRKDMNMQFILMAYRDYFYFRDKKFLRSMYPEIKKAIELVYDWDTDGDLIPDIEGPDQTFDAWGWQGASIYLATLWLAALRAGEKTGAMFGDKKFSDKCRSDFLKLQETIDRKFWNGNYYILWTKGKDKDEAALLDALTGDWYCLLSGLGHILPEDKVKKHLAYCYRKNKARIDPSYMKAYCTPGEDGYCWINGAYPDDARKCFQQYEPWTGIEYAFAVQLWLNGMKKEALNVVREVYLRKIKCGMEHNHIECGGDYYRAMVIGLLWELSTGENTPSR